LIHTFKAPKEGKDLDLLSESSGNYNSKNKNFEKIKSGSEEGFKSVKIKKNKV